jgi:hypothetical protein
MLSNSNSKAMCPAMPYANRKNLPFTLCLERPRVSLSSIMYPLWYWRSGSPRSRSSNSTSSNCLQLTTSLQRPANSSPCHLVDHFKISASSQPPNPKGKGNLLGAPFCLGGICLYNHIVPYHRAEIPSAEILELDGDECLIQLITFTHLHLSR